jgi:hypothetical protein
VGGEDDGPGPERYGDLDLSGFTELELRMYILIKARLASMWELKNCYTLDEALKLYALYRMEQDVEAGRVEDMAKEVS